MFPCELGHHETTSVQNNIRLLEFMQRAIHKSIGPHDVADKNKKLFIIIITKLFVNCIVYIYIYLYVYIVLKCKIK